MNLSTLSFIDFYVSVIDNYGDMGFAVNLALSLHEKYPNLRIRFFSDDLTLFQKFFREGAPEWIQYVSLDVLESGNPPTPSTLICNFFDRPLPKGYFVQFPYEKTIVSFSYFLLHTGLESLHGTTYVLESGCDRVIHFVPSLLSGGGGVIVNPEIERRRLELVGVSKMEAREKFLINSHSEFISESSIFKKAEDLSEVHPLVAETSSGLRVKYICEKKWISVFVYPETVESILEGIDYIQEDVIFFIF